MTYLKEKNGLELRSPAAKCATPTLSARGLGVFDTRATSITISSPLRSHEAMGMLGAQKVMVQVGYPLSAGNRHIQIFYAILDVH
jgi:hypothetical protein